MKILHEEYYQEKQWRFSRYYNCYILTLYFPTGYKNEQVDIEFVKENNFLPAYHTIEDVTHYNKHNPRKKLKVHCKEPSYICVTVSGEEKQAKAEEQEWYCFSVPKKDYREEPKILKDLDRIEKEWKRVETVTDTLHSIFSKGWVKIACIAIITILAIALTVSVNLDFPYYN